MLLQDQHLSSCQYITVECRNTGCGDRVLLSKLEDHLKNECLQRLVKCKDCGRELMFRDLKVSKITYLHALRMLVHLQPHGDNCLYALRSHLQEIPALSYPCYCQEDLVFEVICTDS